MWPTALSRRLGIDHPLVVAPMAGGPTTPALVAASSEAGALGSFAGGYLAPEAIRAAIRDVRARTRRPFAVNLFVPEPAAAPPGEEELRAAAAALEPIGRELGVALRPRLAAPPDFAGQLAVVKEERVPVFSFTFGALPAEEVAALHALGIAVLGSATTVEEARALEASGVDAVVAQGAEAGGHRGTFAGPFERGLVGTLALVPQVVDAVKVPVVAAGGIMDGRGVVAALALGAAAAQLGTAFLATPESGASALHKREVLAPRGGSDPTRLTRAYSGKLVRGFATRFMVDVERAGAILPYPHQNALTGELRQAAARQERADLASMWAGQGVALARARPAGELVRELMAEAERVAARLCER
ncbi:NAD(P)H-dependent flavin oxidoreductase [Anaeromyxobacter diazotrophicus]|uniref:Nitronate monooxygenase n=1 Tax=Anaeromyxobacter diazotrophicus TaxID=2590199 RepID=A0A7I9VIA5_9BACT|nr:nitronate monooxygenase [Anaeromyxobacter diazotrophicus]GEJ56073.1 oxidoreductase [Anaeromyxobacter diazotrophicus]